MNKHARAFQIAKILNELFPSPKIPLHHLDTYTLLIAVLLSAHTTDASVNRVTPHLFAKAKSPDEMIKLSIDEIQECIRPCGLSLRKASAIKKLSLILLEKHEGKVPDTFEELEALPGVGHKTASVVLIQGFNKCAFPVDTHIFRCARRWKLSKGKTVVQVERDLKALFPKEIWNLLHLQMIYFARQYCPARGHKVEACPICKILEHPPLLQK